MAVIRNDVVRFEFEVEGLKEIKRLQSEVDDLKKSILGGVGDEEFDELGESAKKAKPPLEKVKEEADKIKKSVGDIGKKAATTAFNGLKKIAKISFKALAVGITGAATAIGVLVKKSVSAYADFEQLTGGVETLFKDSAGIVKNYANGAFKTAGLSANEYMETVTSFSASLISSCGGDTKKAAELAHVAMVDMSDNANKMGTDMETVMGTYQSLAKGNFAMLDNLKLGYGGTKKELERLIKDASKWDKTVDASSMSYGNIVKAIHAVQEKMDIMGTTQKEAEKTITGSLGMMKSAWGNLMPALIEGGESFDDCVDNLVYSIGKFAENIKPAILKALSGVGKLIDELVPIIEENFPKLVEELLPPLIRAAVALTVGLVKALPTIFKILAKEIPKALKEVWDAIVETLGDDFPILVKIDAFFSKNADSIKGFFSKAGTAIKKFIPVIIALVAAFKLFNGLKAVTSMFGGLFGSLGGGKGGSGGKGGIGGMLSSFTQLGKMNTKTVVKAMANLAIILGAFVGLTALLALIAPEIMKLGDMKSMLQFVVVLGALGLIGIALVKMSKYVGKVKVTTVAKGLANMAIMLVGMGALAAVFIAVLPYIEKLINVKATFKMLTIMTALGAVGLVLGVFAGIVGAIPIPVVLAGLANMALALAGFTAIVVAFGALSKIDGFNDFIVNGGKVLADLCGVLGEMIGSLIGGIGKGVTAALPEMGANISKFAESIKPAFTAFDGINAKSAGDALNAIASFMLKMTGQDLLSFLTGDIDFAGISEGLNSLANEKVKHFFEFVDTLTESSLTKGVKFFETLGFISELPNTGGIGQLFSGENDFAGTADGLGRLTSDKVKNFFGMVEGMNDGAFTKAQKFFEALGFISELPNTGGIGQLFSGENDFAGTANGLGRLTSDKVKNFFAMAEGFGDTAFAKVTSFFEALGYISELPNAGGLGQLFSGTNDFQGTANGLGQLSSEKVKNFLTMVTGMDKGVPDKMISLFKALGEVAKINDEGFFSKLGDMFVGEDDNLAGIGSSLSVFWNTAGSFLKGVGDLKVGNISGLFKNLKNVRNLNTDGTLNCYAGLVKVGVYLQGFYNNAKNFMSLVNQFNSGKLKSLFETLKAVPNIATASLPELKDSVVAIMNDMCLLMEENINKIVEMVTALPDKMGEGLKSAGESLSTALVEIWKDAVKASAAPVNKVIEGANWILKELGSEKRVVEWTPYARGTDGHKGGNALVNDGRGAELVQMPNGRMFIPQGRNVFLPNAPKGMKVLPAGQTARLMGKNKPTFRYADGTGNVDLWSFYENSKGLVEKIVNDISYVGMSAFAENIGKGMVSTASGAMAGWVDKLFESEGGRSLADYVASQGVSQWKSTVVRALKMEGQYSPANVARTLFQMQTESGGNPRAINLWDSNAKKGIPSKGLMQVIDPTFKAYARNGYDKNIYDPLSNILASVRYATSRYGTLAKAYRGVGYSKGVGTVDMPQPSAMSFSYNPESDGYRNQTTVETNTYAPHFEINITGTNDDRSMERKIKRWIAEAWEDMLDTMDSKSPKTQRV